MNGVCLLLWADWTLYCGRTTDPNNRVKARNSGKGANCTRARLPVKRVHFESCEERQEALSREWLVKRMTREEKPALIRNEELL